MYEDVPYLYLTTIGRKTGLPRQIEIWFVDYDGAFYLCSEARGQSHWTQNILADPRVLIQIGDREAEAWDGIGRWVDAAQEPELVSKVSTLMDAKYSWSSGLFVELRPV